MNQKSKYQMANPPAPPASLDQKRLFEGVYWHQEWEIFAGVKTPGLNPVNLLCAKTELPTDLSGQRVLDIGAFNGCFSFECERRGAAEVVAFSPENPDVFGFSRLKNLLGSRVKYVQGSVYSVGPEHLGQFDLVLFYGVLYHLRYPLLAIDRIRTVCQRDVLIETHILTDRDLLRAPLARLSRALHLSALFRATPLWRQYRECELNSEDQSNWFGPNVRAVLEAFESGGFSINHLATWSRGTRAAFRARAVELPSRLMYATLEWPRLNGQP